MLLIHRKKQLKKINGKAIVDFESKTTEIPITHRIIFISILSCDKNGVIKNINDIVLTIVDP